MIKERFKRLLNDLKEKLPNEDFNNASELVFYGEYGVALELICVQLFEYDLAIQKNTKELILHLVIDMALDIKLIDNIRVISEH